jgi:hypothetical protein
MYKILRSFFLDDQVLGQNENAVDDGYWMGLQFKVPSSRWTWVDNWPVLVTNWAPGHPDKNEKRSD